MKINCEVDNIKEDIAMYEILMIQGTIFDFKINRKIITENKFDMRRL